MFSPSRHRGCLATSKILVIAFRSSASQSIAEPAIPERCFFADIDSGGKVVVSKPKHPSNRHHRISIQCEGQEVRTQFWGLEKRTLLELFYRGYAMNPDAPCLGTRAGNQFVWKTFAEVEAIAKNFGAGLVNLGVKPGCKTSTVCIYSKNRMEFDAAQLGCYYYTMVPVPIYDTLGKEAGNYIIRKVQSTVLLVDRLTQNTDLDALTHDSKIKHIVLFEEASDAAKLKFSKSGFQLHSFDSIVKSGLDNPREILPPKEDDMALILNTSGTTGTPKGVVITHKAYTMEAGSADHVTRYKGILDVIGPGDIWYSYLPSAHSFNSVCTFWMMGAGASIGYMSKGPQELLEDLAILKPTIFPIVPRLLNRLYDKIWQNASASPMQKAVFETAASKKVALLEKKLATRETMWDKLVFKKVQALLGSRVRLMIIGSAPVASEVLQFSRAAFGCEILEAYGQTETCGGATCTLPGNYLANSVGGPMSSVEIKLKSVPSMNYHSERGEGEICFRGPTLLSEYYDEPELTKNAVDDEGWLHTGDIGKWNEDGSLRIFDRIKHILKLSQGEYVSPEKIEAIYVKSMYIAQAFVYGDSLQDHLVAILVPDEEAICKYAKQKKISGTFEELCEDPTIRDLIWQEIQAVAKRGKLNSLEVAKAIHIHPELFSVENGLLTPTFKNKRLELGDLFHKQIRELYSVPATS